MDKKTTGIVAYITWIGWLVAFLAGDKEGAKFHLNQALVIFLAGLITNIVRFIPFIGSISSTILGILVFVLWLMGLISACQGTEKAVPVLGEIKILQ